MAAPSLHPSHYEGDSDSGSATWPNVRKNSALLLDEDHNKK